MFELVRVHTSGHGFGFRCRDTERSRGAMLSCSVKGELIATGFGHAILPDVHFDPQATYLRLVDDVLWVHTWHQRAVIALRLFSIPARLQSSALPLLEKTERRLARARLLGR